ncbi:MAG: hypothetical protein ABIW47_04190 [Ginsengibacter sp.]|jgi:hypothetical protein
MQKLFRNVPLFRLMIVLLFSSTIMVACTGNDKAKTETKETVIEKKDSLPPLDTGSKSSTRPETIKNMN